MRTAAQRLEDTNVYIVPADRNAASNSVILATKGIKFCGAIFTRATTVQSPVPNRKGFNGLNTTRYLTSRMAAISGSGFIGS